MPREVGDWTKDKLQILSSYLPGYLGATSRAIDRIYIDGFAGPGTNLLRRSRQSIDGSPLIALKARAENGSKFTKLFFIERDSSTAHELREAIKPWNEDNRAEVVEGDVNVALPSIVRRLNRRAPTIVFLDTEGIEPTWRTVESIAPWRVELLINFPLGMSINRNPDSAKTLAYFGTEECLPILHQGRTGRTRALLDLYKNRLATLGWTYTTTDDRLVKTERNQRLYYLVFVSKVEAGETIMSWVFRQPDEKGPTAPAPDLMR
jgi:three-Cys-motif partner protein